MIKKICFYIFLFFILILNIFLDTRINNYIFILGKCFGKNINVDIKIYARPLVSDIEPENWIDFVSVDENDITIERENITS